MPYEPIPPGSHWHRDDHDDGGSTSSRESGHPATLDTGAQLGGYFQPVYTIARKPRPLNRDGTPVLVPPAARGDDPTHRPEFLKEHELLHRAHTTFFRQDERARLARGEDPMAESRSHRSW